MKVSFFSLCCLAVFTADVSVSDAATSPSFDILPGNSSGQGIESPDVTSVKPIPAAKPKPEAVVPRGNPLWSVPLATLSTTRERPIFSASRRPPPRAVNAPNEPVVAAIAPQPAGPESPPLTLIGSVVGDNDAVAVFVDRVSQGIVRMRRGDVHAGWTLNAVMQREVTLKKADQTETLALKRPGSATGAETAEPMVVPPRTTGYDTSYAPFIPRSTPKNGESDGL